MSHPHLDHPSLPPVKEAFAGTRLLATEFRGETTLVVPADTLHAVMCFLREEEACAYDFLSDVLGVDYLHYPSRPETPSGRFAVIYNLVSTRHNRRLFVKVLLNPSVETSGIEPDPALELDTVTDLWPGAEWSEREVYDMFGIRFRGHPDLRRILTWEKFPAYPLRKDYPVIGRGEREQYEVLDRESA